jgi:hypothetical protein
MELLFVCLAAHDSEFRRWPGGVDRRICQTFAASPAEPGELLLGFSGVVHGTLTGGNYRAVARNQGRTYEDSFDVVPGFDTQVEVLAR